MVPEHRIPITQEVADNEELEAIRADVDEWSDTTQRFLPNGVLKSLIATIDALKADLDEALDACEAQIGAEAHLPNANAAPPIREVLRKHGRLK